MQWVLRFSGLFSAALMTIILSPSLQSFPPAYAIRSEFRSPRPTTTTTTTLPSSSFTSAPSFRNADTCPTITTTSICDPSLVHVTLTLDTDYLRGSIAAVHSILQHSLCPQSIFFHFLTIPSLASSPAIHSLVQSTFPTLTFRIYAFDPQLVAPLISSSVRSALEQPLNYARNYLASLLPRCVTRVIYLDSDLILVDDITKLWTTNLGSKTIGAPEYCHANFTKYFTPQFWGQPRYSSTFSGRNPCYFNTGVMVMDLVKWRRRGYTKMIERWMEIQRSQERIYDLGSLPPFLLVFAGNVAPIEHRWNQHGLGGDNVRGSCRDLHPGPVSLLHWSGSGKPWVRLDSRRPCPLDSLWAPYDLFVHSSSR